MITTIFNVVIGMVFALIGLLLTPLNALIATYMPSLNDAFLAIGDLFGYITDALGWAVSVSGLSAFSLSLIALYYIAKFTLPALVYNIKLAFAWFRTLRH